MSDKDPFEELLESAWSMEIDVLAARLRELSEGTHDLLENAFHVAEALTPEQRALLVVALDLSQEQQARLESMLDRLSAIRQRDDATPSASERPQDGDRPRIARGTMIDERYEIRALLGQGGMGAVYEAHDTKLGRRVAIKFLTAPAGSELASRFVREARTTAQCKHENIVEIHDVGEHKSSPDESGCPFMVLEYLDGETLRRRLSGGAATERDPAETPWSGQAPAERRAPALTPRQALDIIIPVVRALVCAHRRDIVHRDLKPENIFLTRSGAIKVLDFGIAKALSQVSSESADASSVAMTRDGLRTRDGTWLGTPPYMSPEQWSRGEVDQRTDLWTVGVILHEMLTGDHPVRAASNTEICAEVCDLDRPMPRIADTVNGAGALADVIDRCLRKRKSERMASASELLDALEAMRAKLDASARPGTWPGTWPWRTAVGVAILASLLGIFVLTRVVRQDSPRCEIPLSPDGTRGVVVAVAKGASKAARDTHDSLCLTSRELLPQATSCRLLEDECRDDEALARAAAPAATLVIRIDDEYTVRLLPILNDGTDKRSDSVAPESLPLAPIWADLPPVRASSPKVQEQVAKVAFALSRVLAGEYSTAHFDIPPARVHDVGWRFAALTWGLGLIHGKEGAIERSDAIAALQQCAKMPDAPADWYCAVAHYVYAASCDECEDVEDVLERLASEGAMPFQDMAKVRLPRVYCKGGKLAAAVQGLVELDDAWDKDDCARLALTGPAMCVLSRRHDSVDEPTLERMKRLAGLEGLDSCDATGRALAISERAWWHYEHEQWQQAEKDWYQAWKLDPHGKAYRLNWAEALLRQRRDRTDVAQLIGQQLKPENIEADQRSRAAFLRWVATRHRDDASALYALYENAKEGEQVLRSKEVEREICEEPGKDAVCRVYDILTVNKLAAEHDQLRELLFPAGGD